MMCKQQAHILKLTNGAKNIIVTISIGSLRNIVIGNKTSGCVSENFRKLIIFGEKLKKRRYIIEL